MKIFYKIILTVSFLVSCGADENRATAYKTNTSSDARSKNSKLPSELYLLAAVESYLEVSFLTSSNLLQLEDTPTSSIISYHSEEYFDLYDLDSDGSFSKLEILEAYNSMLQKMNTNLSSEKSKYLEAKGILDKEHKALRLAHKSGDMQLVDGLLGGLFGGGLGNVAGGILGVLTKIVFPGSKGKTTRGSNTSNNDAHKAYESLSELKQLILLSNKALLEIEGKLECIEETSDCGFKDSTSYWEEAIKLEIANASVLSELGY